MNYIKFKIWEILLLVYCYFSEIKELAVLIFIFSCFDFLTGVWKSKKINQPITSKRMRDSVTKSIVYGIALIVAFMVQKHIVKDLGVISFFNIVAYFIASVEVKSIYENLTIISGVKFIEVIKNHIDKTIYSNNKKN